MYKQHFRKWTALFLTFIMLMIIPTNAGANTIQPRSDPYYQMYGASLSKTGPNTLHIVFSVLSKYKMEMIGVSYYRIQRKVNGNWSNVTDTIEGCLNMNTVTCTFGDNFHEAVSGVEYRVYAKFYIRTYDGVVSTIDFYSNSHLFE